MKKIIYTLIAAFVACTAVAQTPSAYFMEGSTFRSQLNPAFAPLRGYVNIPVLGGVQVNVSGNLSVSDIFYPVNGSLVTLFDKNVSAAEALGNLRSKNMLGTDARINIYEGENETYIEASAENSGSILYDKEIRDKPRTRRTKRNV